MPGYISQVIHFTYNTVSFFIAVLFQKLAYAENLDGHFRTKSFITNILHNVLY